MSVEESEWSFQRIDNKFSDVKVSQGVNSNSSANIEKQVQSSLEERLATGTGIKKYSSSTYVVTKSLTPKYYTSNLYEQFQSVASLLNLDPTGSKHLTLARLLEHCYQEVKNNLPLEARLEVLKTTSYLIEDTDPRTYERTRIVESWYQDCESINTAHPVTDYYELKKKSALIGNKKALLELALLTVPPGLISMLPEEKQEYFLEKHQYLEGAMIACEPQAWIAAAVPERFGLEGYSSASFSPDNSVERLARLMTGTRLLLETNQLDHMQAEFMQELIHQRSLELSPNEVETAQAVSHSNYLNYCS